MSKLNQALNSSQTGVLRGPTTPIIELEISLTFSITQLPKVSSLSFSCSTELSREVLISETSTGMVENSTLTLFTTLSKYLNPLPNSFSVKS